MSEKYNLAKWINDEIHTSEINDNISEEDVVIYDKIKAYSSDLKAAPFNSEAMLSKVLSSKKEKAKMISLHANWILRIAAVLILVFSFRFAYINLVTITEITNYARQEAFLLPDNSKVILNSGSEIAYNKWNWGNNRQIELAGEAYFKVTKGQKFSVRTNLGTITVLGTQFSIKSRNSRLYVECYEGKVKVKSNNETLILTKGKRVLFENQKIIPSSDISITKPDWTNNQLAFYHDNLETIINEIERTYNQKIILKSENKEQIFTGKIPSNNLKAAIQIISSIYHYTKQSNCFRRSGK